MNFKHYDILSQLVMGYVLLVVIVNFFKIEYNTSYSVVYLAFAFVIGYFINTISSLLESIFYCLIGGKPSNKLLQIKEGKKYTGCFKVRFYETEETIKLLKKDVSDENADTEKLFYKAMMLVNSNEKSRIFDFNGHYAFSRNVLTTMLLTTILLLIKYCCHCETYLIFIPLLLSYVRYGQRAYYYAREVLNEYLVLKNK